jgi:hypothetical protein
MTPTVNQPLPGPIGRYQILGRLGAGGMGTVYRAHDPHLDRVVALKVPLLEGLAEQRAERIHRFQREARAAARILHPHVCPIFDVGEHDGAAFVVMAFVDGQSLQQVLDRRGALPSDQAVVIALQMLDALAAVHAGGVIHRDVKPGNILIDSAGRAILTDFGLARPEAPGSLLTSDGVVMGTPAYMAPEQAAGQADQVGPWTDLYSLGVVLYQMLTGRLPFEGAPAAVLAAVLRDEPATPRYHRPDIDPGLEAVVLRALRKEPGQRFVAADDFRAALGACTSAAPARAEIFATTLLPKQPATLRSLSRWSWWLRRLRWLPGAAAVMFGGLFVAMLVLLLFTGLAQPGSAGPPPLMAFIGGTLLIGLPLMLLGIWLWALAELSFTPEGLRWSAKTGWTGRVRAAAENGVQLDVPDELGETALMLAAAKGQTEVVKVLLLHGVDSSAVSSLGQTAVEIAYARGHGDIVALLQKERRAPHPPERVIGEGPSVRRWLPICAVLGAALVVWYNWITDPWPTRISYEEVRQLVRDKQVKYIQIQPRDNPNKGLLYGEVPVPERHPRLGRGGFWAEIPQQVNVFPDLNGLNPPGSRALPINQSATRRSQPPPHWSIAVVLAVPALIAWLLGLPVGSSNWFPMLPRQRRSGARSLTGRNEQSG